MIAPDIGFEVEDIWYLLIYPNLAHKLRCQFFNISQSGPQLHVGMIYTVEVFNSIDHAIHRIKSLTVPIC